MPKKALSQTLKLSDMKSEDFDTIFYVGGHGPMWDLVDNPDSIALTESFYTSGKPGCRSLPFPSRVSSCDVRGRPVSQGQTRDRLYER
jgi:hypothetical protein